MKVKRIIAGLTALAAAGYMMNPAIDLISSVNTVKAGSVDLDYLTPISLYSTVSETYTYGVNYMLWNFWTVTDSFNYNFTAPQDGTYVISGEIYDPYGSSYIEYVPEYSLEFISEDGISFGAEINGSAKATLKAGERVVVHAGFINNGIHEEHYADSERNGGFKLTVNLDKTSTADNTEPLISQAVSGHELEINGQYGGSLDSDQKVVKYRFTAPVSSEYTFSTAGSNADTYGFMYDESLSECLARNDKPKSGTSECFEITRRLEKNETVFLFVTTYNNSGEGDYRLTVTKGDMEVWPEETNSGIVGDTVTFRVGTDESIVSYNWEVYRDGEGWKTISEEETLTFTLTPEMNGERYYCYVKNAYGQGKSVSFNINIPCNVSIESQSPGYFYYPEGYPVRLFVDAVSETGNTVNYQWQYRETYSYDYSDVEGESHGSELILNNPSDGYYKCIVSDENGVTKTSDTITIQPVRNSDVYSLIPDQESSMYYSFGDYNPPSYFVLNAEKSGKYRITVKDNDYNKSDMISNVMLFKNQCGYSVYNAFSEVNDSNIIEAEIELNKGESALVYLGTHVKFSDASYNVTAAVLEEYDEQIQVPQSAQAVFKSASLTLKDGVTATFKLEAGSEFSEWMYGSYVQFTGETTDKKISFYDVKSVTEDDKCYYLFSIPVRPDRMTEEITAVVHYGTGTAGDTVKFTVQDYLEKLKSDDRYKEQYTEIADSILVYGARSQKYTGYRLSDPADRNVKFNGSDYVVLGDKYTAHIENTNSVRAKTARLELGGNTSLCVKFELPSGSSGFSVSCVNSETGEHAETIAVRDGGSVTVTLPDVRPQDLDAMYEFRLTCDGSTAVVKYSAFSYIKTMLEGNSTSEKLRRLLMALYDYNRAAERLLGETDDESDEDRFADFPLSDGVVYGLYTGNVPFTEYGDVDGNGEVSLIDATLISYYLMGMDVPEFNTKAADVTKDGKITMRDAQHIQSYFLTLYIEGDCEPLSELTEDSYVKKNGEVSAEIRSGGEIYANSEDIHVNPGETCEILLNCTLFNNENCIYMRGNIDCPDELKIEFPSAYNYSGNEFCESYSTGKSRARQFIRITVPDQGKPGEQYKVRYNCIYGTENAEYYASYEFTIAFPYWYGYYYL